MWGEVDHHAVSGRGTIYRTAGIFHFEFSEKKKIKSYIYLRRYRPDAGASSLIFNSPPRHLHLRGGVVQTYRYMYYVLDNGVRCRPRAEMTIDETVVVRGRARLSCLHIFEVCFPICVPLRRDHIYEQHHHRRRCV